MSDIPASTVVLGDGTSALLRAISPADADALHDFHRNQSAQSRYLRYFSPKPELSPTELAHFTNVDFVDRAAFVVEQHGEFLGWASYERWTNRTDAEVAFQVDDGQQGKGIATLLLEHLAAVAQDNGIERFTAQTLGENRAMLSVFAKAGWPVHRRFESGVIDIDFTLDETAEFIDSVVRRRCESGATVIELPLDETAEFIDCVERREQRADSRAVAQLLLPTSIAVIGASDQHASVGETIWKHVASNEHIRVYPVNPNRDSVGGVPAFASVADIPDEIVLAVIAVPAGALESTIDECIAKRVRGAVVITAPEPGSLDVTELVARARRNGLRIIGPASMGLASPRPDASLQAALVDVRLPGGKVAVSLQSGTLGSSLLRQAAQLHLGLSWFVSLGDKMDISANDLLQFWEDDEATHVIAIYTESLGNPRKFARIARRVSRSRPIVSVRTGAALLDPANAALYRQTGLIEVPTVPALLDTARVFATQPLMRGNRVAVVSNSRSPTVLTEATLSTAGLEPTPPPVPLSWSSAPGDYDQAVRSALADDGIDALIVIHAPPTEHDVKAPRDVIAAACEGAEKPVVVVMLGTGDGPLVRDSPIPSFSFPEQAAAVLARVAAYSAWRRTEQEEDANLDEVPDGIDRAAATAVIDAMLTTGSTGPHEVGALLAAYGITMAPTRRVSAGDAVEAADAVGYPVAIKADQRRFGRSVEAGVALDLRTADDVAEAVTVMRDHLGSGAEIVNVQPMVAPGVDIRIRVADDERLGPIITVGLGGVQADIIGDEVSRLAPVSPSSGRRMVEATRAAGALDEDELTLVGEIVARVAQLASDHPRIESLDLNPVIVADRRCRVVDATVQLGEAERHEPFRRLDA